MVMGGVMAVAKKRRLASRTIYDLPEELIDVVVRHLQHTLPAQAAAASTCTLFHESVGRLRLSTLSLRSSSVFRARLWTPHYSRDLKALGEVLSSPRLRELRTLRIVVDAPAFSVGNGRKSLLDPLALKSLDGFRLDCHLSRQLNSRLPLAAPALSRMVQWMPNLRSMCVSDVANLGHSFFSAVQRLHALEGLAVVRCTLIPTFAHEFGRLGMLTGRMLPRGLKRLKLDIGNLSRSFRAAWEKGDGAPLFLSGLPNLERLYLAESAETLACDVWYALRCIDVLAQRLVEFRSPSRELCSLFEFAKEVVGDDMYTYRVSIDARHVIRGGESGN